MAPAQIVVYGDPGKSGISDTAMVAIILGALIGIPTILGIVLRLHDRRRGRRRPNEHDTPGSRPEHQTPDPPPSLALADDWGRNGTINRSSTRHDWEIVGVLAALLAIAYLLTQIL